MIEDEDEVSETSSDEAALQRDRVKRALKSPVRLESIRHSRLLETPNPTPAFERAARIAARALRAPVAQLNLVSDKLHVPLAVYTEREEDNETWRARRRAGGSYCKYVVWSKEGFRVEDAREHSLVKLSHATRDLGIVAYLGAPVHGPPSARGARPVIGTLCVVDFVPRTWTAADLDTLADLAAGVSEEIDYRIRRHDDVKAVEGQSLRLLDSAGSAILATDAHGVTTYANPTALHMLGYTEEELIGRDQHALIHHSRLDGSRYPESECPNYIARTQGRRAHAIDDTFWKIDGTPITVDSTMTPIYDRGEVIGTVLTFQDVTERRNKQQAEHSARVAAETANRAKTELMAGMSHELRIPIASIGAHAEQVERELIDIASVDQRAHIRNIQRSQQHLAELVDNMAAFAALELKDERP